MSRFSPCVAEEGVPKPVARMVAVIAMAVAAFALLMPSQAFAYFSKEPVSIGFGSGSVTLTEGESVAISLAIDPLSEQQLPGCGMAICPEACGGLENPNTGVVGGCLSSDGWCSCGGLTYQTYTTQVSVQSSNPSVARASAAGGALQITGVGEGEATITVYASLAKHADAANSMVVTVLAAPDPGHGNEPGGPDEPGGSISGGSDEPGGNAGAAPGDETGGSGGQGSAGGNSETARPSNGGTADGNSETARPSNGGTADGNSETARPANGGTADGNSETARPSNGGTAGGNDSSGAGNGTAGGAGVVAPPSNGGGTVSTSPSSTDAVTVTGGQSREWDGADRLSDGVTNAADGDQKDKDAVSSDDAKKPGALSTEVVRISSEDDVDATAVDIHHRSGAPITIAIGVVIVAVAAGAIAAFHRYRRNLVSVHKHADESHGKTGDPREERRNTDA